MLHSTLRTWQDVPLRSDSQFDTYFHTLSHDLRTPLQQITGFAELLNLDKDLAVGQREYTTAIISACGHLNIAVLAHLGLIEHSLLAEDRSARAGEEAASDVRLEQA